MRTPQIGGHIIFGGFDEEIHPEAEKRFFPRQLMLFPLLAKSLDETDVADGRLEIPNRRFHAKHHLRRLNRLCIFLQVIDF